MHLYRQLKKILGSEQVSRQLLKRYANSRDASFYRLLPRVIVTPRNEDAVLKLLALAREQETPIVFRAAGTSLSGQAVSDSILVRVDQHWRGYEVGDQGRTITLQAGVVGAWANTYLSSYGCKIGPDPGSINAALIAGIVANNASGITSGTRHDSYHTLDAIRAILPSGFVLDTRENRVEEKLKHAEPAIYKTLVTIRDEIRGNEELVKLIQHKYSIKNTMGYALGAFLDYDTPADILAHLMVGSEGTLGFLSEVRLRTVPILKEKAVALLLFPSLEDAVDMVPPLKGLEPEALELMDETALAAIRDVPGMPAELQQLLPAGTAALLVQFHAKTLRTLHTRTNAARRILKEANLLVSVDFKEKPEDRERLWKVRRELGPLHAGRRPDGTIVVSEDICFQLEDLAAATRDLKHLLQAFNYEDAIIFGHAGDGNLHFKLSIDFHESGARERYRAFMEQLGEMVAVKYRGSLKAEHGTGRNMAPFLELEWGEQAVDIMRRIKKALDPQGILNPNVIFTDDPLLHLRDIKPIPDVDASIDACIECGLCEPFCPSHDLTLSPRERINVLREIRILAEGSHQEHMQAHRIQQEFNYAGVETCARDGLCALACPVNVNTGEMMKAYHNQLRGRMGRYLSLRAIRHFRGLNVLVRGVLKTAAVLTRLFKPDTVSRVSRFLKKYSTGLIPAWSSHMPTSVRPILSSEAADPDLVYMPSCLSRTMAGSTEESKQELPEIFIGLLREAGISARLPKQVNDLCCGLAFHSKGFMDAASQAAARTVDRLWQASDQGRLPIVMDTTPCSRFMREYDQVLSGISAAKWRQLKIVDVIEYLHDTLIPKLDLEKVAGEAVLHPTCSCEGLGLTEKMVAIARHCAESVTVPAHAGCCGFAGDRGLHFPELTESATRLERDEVKTLKGEAGHYSSSRTCEIGMSEATQRPYESLIYLVDQAVKRH